MIGMGLGAPSIQAEVQGRVLFETTQEASAWSSNFPFYLK